MLTRVLRYRAGLPVLLLASVPAAAQPVPGRPESRAVQRRPARGWNAWDSRSMLTHVTPPVEARP